MAATLTQTAPTRVFFGPSAGGNITFGSSCTSGSRIVVQVTTEHWDRPVTGVTDSGGNTYTRDHYTAGSGAGDGVSETWSCQNASSSAVTVTVTLSGNSYGYIKAYEVSGLATSSAVDATGGGNNGAGGATVNANVTTVTANCAIFSAVNYYGFTSIADSGFTASHLHQIASSQYHAAQYMLDAGSAGAKSIAFGSSSNATSYSATTVAYKLAAGGGSSNGAASYYYAQQ